MKSFVERRFDYRGYPCVVILQSSGHRCGYVGLTSKSKYFNVDYDDIYIECHGGITYAESHLFDQSDDDIWWIGFDCAHYGDAMDYKAVKEKFRDDTDVIVSIDLAERIEQAYPTSDTKIRTTEYVASECKYIVDQLIEAGGDSL